MKQKNFWLRALNVRPEEGWLVKKLYWLQFLQGAGIAFFFTASFAQFLAHYPINELPIVFIYSSLLLWIGGFIYSKLEHKFNISNLALIITVFIIASMLSFRLVFEISKTGWFLYWMLAWFNLLYLLNNLEFWGIASLLFDTRQSRRLFAVISAGDIPAKFIGYSLALFTVEYIGTINLLWAGVICMLASIPFLLSVKRSGKLLEVQHKKHLPSRHTVQKVSKIVKNFAGNALIRRLSLLSIIITGTFIIINFSFYAGVREAFSDDISLAKFIAFFLAIVRVFSMILKMIFTSRLINKIGLVPALMITPLGMILLIALIIITQNIEHNQKTTVYLFGATSIVVDVLRSSINTPVFLTLMQPLSNLERLRAHTIVKGIMDPFASLITGLLLLLMINYHPEEKVNLLTLSYVLLGVGVLWIIGVYQTNKEYLQTIIKTISSRYFDRESFSINDSRTIEWLKQKAKTGSETEVINILNMLFKSNSSMAEELIVMALKHPSEKVKLSALKLIQHQPFPPAADILLPYLKEGSSPQVIAESIKIMCRNGVDNQLILPFVENNNAEVKQAALAGLFFYGSEKSINLSESLLRQMILSENSRDRLMVAEILGSQENCKQVDLILQLMSDNNIHVRKAAFLAAGKSGDQQLLQELMNRIHGAETEIIQPLYIAGERSLPLIAAHFHNRRATRLQKEKLILLVGRIGGGKAHKLLLGLLNSHPEEYMTIVKAMYRSYYVPKAADQPFFISMIKRMLSRSAGIIYMQSSLEPWQKKYQLLNNSFNLELKALRESLLYVFALIYDRDLINKVRTAYATGKRESIINAMEIIDIAVRKDLANHFNTIFEPGDVTERMHGLRKIYPVEFFENVERVLACILEEDTRPYNNWTMACCLYTSKKQRHELDHALIRKYTSAENLMVRETAFFAL